MPDPTAHLANPTAHLADMTPRVADPAARLSPLPLMLVGAVLALLGGLIALVGNDRPTAASATGDLHLIKHVVIIMQENRSFDTYFGTLPGADGIPTALPNGTPSVCLPDPAAHARAALPGAVLQPDALQ